MMDTGPTICLPHPLQNACPGCTAFPHPSQNMTPLPRIHPDRARELQNSCNKGYAEKIQAVPDLLSHRPARCYPRELLARNVRINEEATRQLGGLFFQGRIVPTEAKPSKLSGEIL